MGEILRRGSTVSVDVGSAFGVLLVLLGVCGCGARASDTVEAVAEASLVEGEAGEAAAFAVPGRESNSEFFADADAEMQAVEPKSREGARPVQDPLVGTNNSGSVGQGEAQASEPGAAALTTTEPMGDSLAGEQTDAVPGGSEAVTPVSMSEVSSMTSEGGRGAAAEAPIPTAQSEAQNPAAVMAIEVVDAPNDTGAVPIDSLSPGSVGAVSSSEPAGEQTGSASGGQDGDDANVLGVGLAPGDVRIVNVGEVPIFIDWRGPNTLVSFEQDGLEVQAWRYSGGLVTCGASDEASCCDDARARGPSTFTLLPGHSNTGYWMDTLFVLQESACGGCECTEALAFPTVLMSISVCFYRELSCSDSPDECPALAQTGPSSDAVVAGASECLMLEAAGQNELLFEVQ